MENARQRLDIISDCILDYINKSIYNNTIDSNGLYMGDSGIQLFVAYYSKYISSKKFSAVFDDFFSKTISNGLNENLSDVSFCTGLSGNIYSLFHLVEHKLIDYDLTGIYDAYKKYLTNSMLSNLKNGNYDLLGGALGQAIFLLRYNDRTIEDLLIKTVDLLEETGIKSKDTINWEYSDGEYKAFNLSIPHGSAGIIIFLSELISAGIKSDKIYSVLKMSLNHLSLIELDINKYKHFYPNLKHIESDKTIIAHLAWCKGDLGCAYALWIAGKALCDKASMDKAIEIFTFHAKRSIYYVEEIRGNMLCHGKAGVAHFFNKMYKETSVELFKDTCDFWTTQIISKDDILEIREYSYDDDCHKYNLLNGMSGIGLFLISYLNRTQGTNNWDEVLLLNNKSLFKNIIHNHLSISDTKARYTMFSEQTTFRS